MPSEPPIKRAVTFVDGQNLFHSARETFGYTYPNYDVRALSTLVATGRGWDFKQARFYTGIPDPTDDPFWNQFWTNKLRAMSREGVFTFSRPLRYRNRRIKLPGGAEHSFLAAEEKGIDVRIALDIIRLAHRDEYDVAIIFSQDQDLSEVADEVRSIARERRRWIKLACAFPVSPTSRNRRGINGTDWIPIDRTAWESCLDPRDHRGQPRGRGDPA